MDKKIVRVMKSGYGTLDITLYGFSGNDKVVDWFSLLDVWGSGGYDRYKDGGRYFEIPAELYDILPSLHFILREGIEISIPGDDASDQNFML